MDKTRTNTKPSPLIIVAKETSTNEKYTSFLLEKRNKVKLDVINNRYRGSATAKNEFIISLGSKAMNDAPTNANFLVTNFLQIKYTGIAIKIEIITANNF